MCALPDKPVSAYALFFRDTQEAIRRQNAATSFGEVSRIVASMWNVLDSAQREIYKKKEEQAKKEYLKTLARQRAHQSSEEQMEKDNTNASTISLPQPQCPQQENQHQQDLQNHSEQPVEQHMDCLEIRLEENLEKNVGPLEVKCVRDGCENMAVHSPSWDAEYCCCECVVAHCKDIFKAWVAAHSVETSSNQ